jgi:hypothetical protein
LAFKRTAGEKMKLIFEFTLQTTLRDCPFCGENDLEITFINPNNTIVLESELFENLDETEKMIPSIAYVSCQICGTDGPRVEADQYGYTSYHLKFLKETKRGISYITKTFWNRKFTYYDWGLDKL